MPICTNQRKKMKLPLNLCNRGVQKVYVCLHKNSTHDAYDKRNHFSSKKRKWLCLVPIGQTGQTGLPQIASRKPQYINQLHHTITNSPR